MTSPALAADGKRLDHKTFQQDFGTGRERRCHANVALEPPRELVTADGFRNHIAGGQNPKAPAGKLAFQIRHHLA